MFMFICCIRSCITITDKACLIPYNTIRWQQMPKNNIHIVVCKTFLCTEQCLHEIHKSKII